MNGNGNWNWYQNGLLGAVFMGAEDGIWLCPWDNALSACWQGIWVMALLTHLQSDSLLLVVVQVARVGVASVLLLLHRGSRIHHILILRQLLLHIWVFAVLAIGSAADAQMLAMAAAAAHILRMCRVPGMTPARGVVVRLVMRLLLTSRTRRIARRRGDYVHHRRSQLDIIVTFADQQQIGRGAAGGGGPHLVVHQLLGVCGAFLDCNGKRGVGCF